MGSSSVARSSKTLCHSWRARVQFASLAFETKEQLKYYYACDEEGRAEGRDMPYAEQFYHSAAIDDGIEAIRSSVKK